uniref:Uncharacterized protein n=1 Tax=Apis cerana TaxID=7461 RepID=V9IFS4_APICE
MANISNFKDKTQIKSQDIQVMGSIKRTEGDGMENVTAEKIEIKQTKCRLGETLIYHPTDLKQLSSIPPVTPNGPIVNLKPKYVTNVKDEKHILNSLKLKRTKIYSL